jgi:hypothetical protein
MFKVTLNKKCLSLLIVENLRNFGIAGEPAPSFGEGAGQNRRFISIALPYYFATL